MSQWTHICGAIRFDGLLVKHQPALVLIKQAFQKNIPEGSEGPIQIDVVYTGYEDDGDEFVSSSSVNIGTIIFSGDLRDYENYQEIYDWVVSCVGVLKENGIFIRGCSIIIDVEYKDRYVLYDAYNDETVAIQEIIMKSIKDEL